MEPFLILKKKFIDIEIESTNSNIGKLKVQTSQATSNFQIASPNLLTINASSSSTSSSSAPTSSSINENCSRIRHFSENDSNEATRFVLPVDSNQSDAHLPDRLTSETERGLHKTPNLPTFEFQPPQMGNFYSSNNHLFAGHNEQHMGDSHGLIDDYMNGNMDKNKFEDEDGNSNFKFKEVEILICLFVVP